MDEQTATPKARTMEFSTRLKDLRAQSALSQEQLARRIGVSRQAITKWESGAGRPELESLVALADVFTVSVDALLGVDDAHAGPARGEYRYESATNYDVDGGKHFDIDCGSIYACAIRGYDGEQLRVRVVSNTVANLARHFKVSVDDRPKRLDVQVRRGTGISETLAKDDVTVIIWVPQRYVTTVECAAKAQEAHVRGLTCDGLELDVRTPRLSLDDVHTHVEVNCNLDMEIDCASIDGRIDVNQLSSTSRITVPKDVPIAVLTHGLRTRTIVGAGAPGRGFAQHRRAQRRGERADHRGQVRGIAPPCHVTAERYHEDPWLEDNMAMLKNTSPSTFSSPVASFPPLARVLPLPPSAVCCAAVACVCCSRNSIRTSTSTRAR